MANLPATLPFLLGDEPNSGTATGGYTWAGSASGRHTSRGTATGGYTWAGTAAGKRTPKASGAGAYTWAGTVAPIAGTKQGNAAGAYTWTGSASGRHTSRGTTAGAYTWAGTATGVAPITGAKRGTAAGSYNFTGAAAGRRASRGVGSGSYRWTGAATSNVTFAPGAVSQTEELTDIEKLNKRLLEGDLLTRAIAADEAAEYEDPLNKTWTIEVYDKFWQSLGILGDDVMELTGTDSRNGNASATLKIKGGSEFTEVFANCETTMVGVVVTTGGIRMAFYVDTFKETYSESAWTGTANLLGIYDILNYLQIWPNFLLPIQVQIPSHAIFIWGICTAIEVMVSECALRIQSGLNEFINNAGSLNPDIRAWFGTLLQSNGNIFTMLKTPLYVKHHNPLLDTSPLIARTVRMESCGTVIADVVRPYGVDVRVDLWLPGDDQPDAWAFLDQPTYVVSVTDRSQVEGPTATVLDSVIRTVVDVGGSFFGEIPGIINEIPGMSGTWTAPILGLNYVPPWAVLIAPEPPQRGSVVNCEIDHHTQKGWQHIVGGRSPKWLNDLLNATFAWIIDSVSILIGITGIPSNLLEGFLNNAFLAFQLIQHYQRRHDAGPYHPAIEVFHATTSSPYNIETLFAFINALWDSRGYVSAQATFRNGEIYTLGKDVFKGGLVSVLYRGRTKLFTDYVETIHFRFTPTERDVLLQIGDGKAEEAPLAKHQRFITGIFESINSITLAPQS